MTAVYSNPSFRDEAIARSPVEADARVADRYLPYAVDWRFLPEPALLIKDAARHALAAASNAAARATLTRGVWANTLGRRTLDSVTRAGRIFIHIPKTGGTSVCACLYGRNLPHYTRSFFTAAYGRRIAQLPSFSIVRDPVDRLQSAYRFMRAGGTELMATSRFESVLMPACHSFADFVRHLVEHPMTIHRLLALRPQSDFVLDDAGELQVDQVFLSDVSGEPPSGLAAYLGIDRLPRLNSSSLPAEPVDAAIRARIEALYAADVRLIERVRQLRDRALAAAA